LNSPDDFISKVISPKVN